MTEETPQFSGYTISEVIRRITIFYTKLIRFFINLL